MTHMYYHDEELGPQDYEGTEKAESDGFPVSDKKSHLRLHEIEEQLQMAETRCNTLKGQLEHMKNVYHKSSSSESPRKKPSKPSTPTKYIESIYQEDGVTQKVSVISTPSLEPSRDQVSQPIRQSSHVISTDTTGAAVLTINHILTGITESVNRLSQLHSHLGTADRKFSPRTRNFPPIQANTPYGERSITGPPEEEEEVQIPERLTSEPAPVTVKPPPTPPPPAREKSSSVSVIEELSVKDPTVKIRSKVNLKRKNRHNKHVPNQTSPAPSPVKKSMGVTAKHTEKKFHISPARTNTGLVKSTSTVCNRWVRKLSHSEKDSMVTPPSSKKRKLKRLQQTTAKNISVIERNRQMKNITNEKLIELYHNVSIKESDSGDSNTGAATGIKSTTFGKATSQKTIVDAVVPPLRISSSIKRDLGSATRKAASENKDASFLSPIEETDYTEPSAPRAFASNLCSTFDRSYQLPTIASRLKQVAKSYLSSFNFRAIPFCAAKSITPSHNIGINIQQVMSIIKTRHPINGLSPTLAHNIGLAAEKLNSKPLHALVSSLSSRVGYSKHCPMTRSMFNYQMLQEMAKNIPDENLVGLELSPTCNTEDQSISVEIKREEAMKAASAEKTQMIWSRSSHAQSQCTCAPAEGDSFQHVFTKYTKYGISTTPCSQLQHNTPISQQTVPKYAVVKPRSSKTISRKIRGKPPVTPAQREPSLMERRQKSLKEVLQNLHDDFDAMNTKYEDLRKDCGTSDEPNETMMKELEKMEAELNNKEEEINMVLTLYKEITALKEQVKMLKKKASTTTVANNKVTGKPYPEPQTAIHLSKLLREVQNFQQHYKVKAAKK